MMVMTILYKARHHIKNGRPIEKLPWKKKSNKNKKTGA